MLSICIYNVNLVNIWSSVYKVELYGVYGQAGNKKLYKN